MADRRHAVRLAVVLTAALLYAGILVWLYVLDPAEEGFLPCPLYTLFHVYCPGCGAARALHSLLHGRFSQAFRFNGAFVLLFPLLTAYGIVWAVDFCRGRPSRINRRLPQPLLYGILGALLVYGVLRNYIPLLAPTAL